MLIRIVAPYFCCGIIVNHPKFNVCAPIIKYMSGWSKDRVISYCKSKGWNAEILDNG